MKRLYVKWMHVLLLLVLFCSCSKGGKQTTIGVDPTFFPLEVRGREANIFAFSNELLEAIGKLEGITFERVTTSWDNLLWGLREKRYDAALSALDPYVFNTSTYAFSDIYLPTGPVLVVARGSEITSLADLKNSEVAVGGEEAAKYVLSQDASILVQLYSTFPQALNDVDRGAVGGALVPYIPAISYLNNLYQGKLIIVSRPFLNEGLRLITLKDEQKSLLKAFNRGLATVRENGQLELLLKKWALMPM